MAKGEQDRQPGASDMRELVWDDELAAIAQRSNLSQSLEHTISCKVQLIVVTFKSDRMTIHSSMVNSVLGTLISCNIRKLSFLKTISPPTDGQTSDKNIYFYYLSNRWADQ